jgi:uncharacterized protein (UPF0147 family)
MIDEFSGVVLVLSDLLEDNSVPRNVKLKIESIKKSLSEKKEEPLKVNKALDLLEEISNDSNIQMYTRTQIWNIISMLEAKN